eukprot:403364935
MNFFSQNPGNLPQPPQFYSRPSSKIQRLKTAKIRQSQSNQLELYKNDRGGSQSKSKGNLLRKSHQAFKDFHNHGASSLSGFYQNPHLSNHISSASKTLINTQQFNKKSNNYKHNNFMQIEEELQLKSDINLQLAINGFVRRQTISTKIDKTKPIKIVSQSGQLYASLAESKKYMEVKQDIERELRMKQKEQLQIQETYQGSRLQDIMSSIRDHSMGLGQNGIKHQYNDQQNFNQINDQQNNNIQSRYRHLKSNNGLVIVGGYKDYLKDRHGNVYKNTTVYDSIPHNSNNKSLLTHKNINNSSTLMQKQWLSPFQQQKKSVQHLPNNSINQLQQLLYQSLDQNQTRIKEQNLNNLNDSGLEVIGSEVNYQSSNFYNMVRPGTTSSYDLRKNYRGRPLSSNGRPKSSNIQQRQNMNRQNTLQNQAASTLVFETQNTSNNNQNHQPLNPTLHKNQAHLENNKNAYDLIYTQQPPSRKFKNRKQSTNKLSSNANGLGSQASHNTSGSHVIFTKSKTLQNGQKATRGQSGKSNRTNTKIGGWNAQSSLGGPNTGNDFTPNNEDLELTDQQIQIQEQTIQ